MMNVADGIISNVEVDSQMLRTPVDGTAASASSGP